MTDIPTRQTIASIYQKFLDIGSIENVSCRGRPTAITNDKMNEMEQALSMELVNNVRNIARKTNISKSQANQIIGDIIGFKPDLTHCTQ